MPYFFNVSKFFIRQHYLIIFSYYLCKQTVVTLFQGCHDKTGSYQPQGKEVHAGLRMAKPQGTDHIKQVGREDSFRHFERRLLDALFETLCNLAN